MTALLGIPTAAPGPSALVPGLGLPPRRALRPGVRGDRGGV